jgi:hypothetical protein
MTIAVVYAVLVQNAIMMANIIIDVQMDVKMAIEVLDVMSFVI